MKTKQENKDMKIFNYPSPSSEKKLQSIISRAPGFTKKDYQYVSRIVEDVKKNGDKALIKYTSQFDSSAVTIQSLKVSDKEFASASKKVGKTFLKALNRAASQIETFHKKQLRNSWITSDRPGTLLGQLINPVDGAGIYVPGAKGGKTPLVSTVLMCAIPAKVAGVKNIFMVTPPTKSGSINPHLLVAAKKVGINAVFKTGSAWAIAALAHGTETIPKADVIVGPGNIYVTLAKMIVTGTVGIDMLAGPSEILVIADDSATPQYCAADMLSQAEHDAFSSSILITTSNKVAESVAGHVEKQLAALSRKDIAISSLKSYGAIFSVPDLNMALELANRIAPEHLELHIKNPFQYIGQIRNAGAVFIGEFTPEPVGDYIAGTNHVLPTAGTARFSSALSVDNFIKKTSIVHYSKQAFKKEAKDITCLADIEGLDAHANSVSIRLKKT